MSKSRDVFGEPFEFDGENSDAYPVLAEAPEEVLDVAHEALSKLYQKSHKRGKNLRLPRRREAWQ